MADRLKTALVTGAGSGMGKAIAETLAELGMKVALIGRERGKLEAARAAIGEDRCVVETCDVADRAAVASMVKRVSAAFGSIDVLICNAGVNVPNRALDVLEPSDWDKMIAINLTGAYNLVHHVLPKMRERKNGLVVQICSISGLRASVLGGVGYSASKFGQAALGIGIGREEASRGIGLTVIYPGEVNTPILDKRPVPVGPERCAAILQSEDVALAVRFLVELHPRGPSPRVGNHADRG